MVGLNVPVIPVEHQYIVTEAHPEIVKRKAQGLPEMGVLRESDSSWYMREEAGGLLLGPYEKGAPACYVDGPSADSEYELFPEDLDRLAPHIETAIARVPAFGEVGVKKVYNGAIAYTPDGSPIVGPAPGREETSGSTKAIRSASPRPAAPAGSSPNGSSRASRASTCSASIRAASALTRSGAISSRRTRRPTPRSSPSTIPTRSAAPRGRCARRPATGG